MRPLRIYLKNFMNHRESQIDCTVFESVLIVGKSHQSDRISNGVGKTTLFRGMEYAWFNQSYATTLDKIVREGTKKAIVELDFELGGETYRIYRHRTSAGAADVRLYKKVGSEFESITERTPTATDAKIRELIKITHKAYCYSVLFRQADLTGITSVQDPKKRREILKEPLNLTAYSKLETLAGKRVTPLKKDIVKYEGAIEILGDPDKDIKEATEYLEQTLKGIKYQNYIINANKIKITEKRKTLDDLKATLNADDVDIHKSCGTKEAEVIRLERAHKSVHAAFVSTAQLLSKRKTELKDLEEQKVDEDFAFNKISTRDEVDLPELQANLAKVQADESRGTEILASIRAKIEVTKKTLPESDECPTCQQSITEDYRKHMHDTIVQQLFEFRERAENVSENLEKCRAKEDRLTKEVQDEKDAIVKQTRIEEHIASLVKQIKSKREDIASLETQRSNKGRELTDLDKVIEETKEHLKELKDSAGNSNTPELNEKIFAITEEIQDIEAENKAANDKISEHSATQGGLEERIGARSDDKLTIKKTQGLLDSTKSELKIRTMVVEAFSSRGIPSFIIQTVLDELQFEANEALREIRPELDVQIDADLNFVYRRHGKIRDYSQLSHGQHVYIALAFKRGTARVIQKRLNIPDLKILEFDEVDAHLDEAGVDAFADAIRKWQKDFTIFVITHNKELKDKFTHAIVVEEGLDGSEARLVTSW